ncbi:MAG: phosphoribosylglycinamide formyltransferase [Thermomicrobiales bacterium]
MTRDRPLRVAVLLSGSGRTLENIVKRAAAGTLGVEIPIVISSRAGVRGVEIARNAGIETHVVRRREAPTPRALSRRVLELLDSHDVDLMLLAGYLLQLEILPQWRGKILNIHPSLLPLFGGKGMYGHHVHEAVLASGMKVSGCSVHIVTEEYDAGPIVAQRCVPVLPGDTPADLGARVFEAECELYPEALQFFVDGRVRLEGDRVTILPAK